MSTTIGRRLRSLAMVAGLATLAAACAPMPTPYQPADQSGYGYSEQQIESNRYRIAFTGNYDTPLPMIYNYVLLRAADIAKQTQNDYFIDVSQHTEADTQYTTTYFGQGGWGWGGRGWGGWGGGLATADTHVRSRYTALMDIQVFKGAKPADNPHAYNAQEVLERLGGQVNRTPTP